MAKQKEQFDDNLDLKVSDKLNSDLDSLFKPRFEIPHEVDMAILNKASQKLSRPRSVVRMLRWIGPVAAAAAIILFVCISKVPQSKVSQTKALASVSTDIDHNGKVDILDAFKLAKLIQSEKGVDKKWDINGDGRVDSEDVDDIALVAVSLE